MNVINDPLLVKFKLVLKSNLKDSEEFKYNFKICLAVYFIDVSKGPISFDIDYKYK